MSDSKIAWKDLDSTFGGAVITPGDAEYDTARAIFPGGFDRRPAAIVRVADTKDVARVFEVARQTGLGLSVRGGGHTPLCVADGAIMADLRALNSLDIDVKERTVLAGAGLTAAEVTAAADEHGMVVGFGDTGSVGIGGITLGGGVGFLVRKYGMTIDNLLAAEVVTPSGTPWWWTLPPSRTCSGRSAVAAETSGWRRASSTGCTSCPR